MDFGTFVFVAMLTVMPKQQKHVDLKKENLRLLQLANSMATAVEDNPGFKIFDGPAEKLAAASLLVATAWGESGFRKDIQTCKAKGDGGRSITSFQMMKPWALSRRKLITKEFFVGEKKHSYQYWDWVKVYTEKQLCASTDLAAEQSLYMFKHLHNVCKRAKPANLFAGYGTGKCHKRVKATDNRCYSWQRLSKKLGLKGAHCEKMQPITLDVQALANAFEKNQKWVNIAERNLWVYNAQ
jgi:hypothetical protein